MSKKYIADKIEVVNEIDEISTDGTLAGNSDTAIPTEKAVKTYIDTILGAIYPVGSVYTNATDNTNPTTLLGFGTWTAFGTGRVPVGFDAGQTEFDSAEETGGAKTVTLTASQSGVPAHPHHQRIPNGSTGSSNEYGVLSPVQTDGADGGSGIYTDNNTAASASSSHSNLQPYITVYMWKRTA